MKYNLGKNNNNRKKLIIGVSILFCAVILIIGATLSYFTQSGIGDAGNLIAVDINGSIGYDDSVNPYMRQGLIPAKEEIAIQAFNLEGVNKCVDKNGYSACSIYQFTLTNNSDVTQELMIDLIPTINTFGNLKYILYEVNNGVSEKQGNSQKLETITNEMILNNDYKSYSLNNYLFLEPEQVQTYQLLFFINDIGIDQTSMDAGKNFGAGIKVSSIASGTYFLEEFGDGCWTASRLEDNTYRLDSFIGYDSNNESGIKDICSAFYEYDNGYYTVNVPSRVGGRKISTLGNWLFVPTDKQFNVNKNWQVKEYNISEGITIVEDGQIVNVPGYGEQNIGTFFATGYNVFNDVPTITEGIVINFPSTIKYIGDYAFNIGYIKSVNLPEGLEFIGNRAFGNMRKEISFVIPSTVHTIDESAFAYQYNIKNITFNVDASGNNNLKTIGQDAFRANAIQSLVIPASVTSIGNSAFKMNENLTTLIFEENSSLTAIGDYAFSNTNISKLTIPSGVTTIGKNAFEYNEYLTSLTFEGALDGTSKLETIGQGSFDGCNLNYATKSNPLILPTNVKRIGRYAFNSAFSNDGNLNLRYILYLGNDENILNNKGFTEQEGEFEHWYYNGTYNGNGVSGEIQTTLLTSLDQMTE